MITRKMAYTLFCGLILLIPGFGYGAASPKQFIETTITQVLEILNAAQFKDPATLDERRKALEKVIEGQFDFEDMSRKAIGREWKNIGTDKRKEFTGLFTTLLKKIYLDKFDNYAGEKISVGDVADLGKEKFQIETLLHADQDEIPIYYSVKNVKGTYAIYDVNIEGVGLIQNYRSQFQKILADKGIDGLITQLKEM